LALEAAHPAFGQAAFHFRAFSALASVILHAAVFTGIFLVGVGGEMGPAGDGSGGISIIHVGGVASPAVSAPAGSDDISPVAPATSSVEQVAEVQKAVPVRIEKKVKTEERTKPAKPAKSVNSTNRAERSGEPAQPEAAASAGGAGGGTASGGLGDAAKPGTIAGDGKPFVFSLAEVNGKPGIVKRVPVVYPRDARQKHVTGQVLVRFHLDADGTVSHLSIKSASPPDIFNENTLAAVRQWRFSPATMGGRPVPVWVELPIEFDLRR
jgi:TonB family protein